MKPIHLLIVSVIFTAFYLSSDANAVTVTPSYNTFQVVTETATCYDMVKMTSGEILVLGLGRCS